MRAYEETWEWDCLISNERKGSMSGPASVAENVNAFNRITMFGVLDREGRGSKGVQCMYVLVG
jgi:hypothetical protein